MDVLFQRGRRDEPPGRSRRLPDAPSYSAVRALLRILEEKGHARHDVDGPRYVYLPPRWIVTRRGSPPCTAPGADVFDGSAGDAVAALLGSEGARMARLKSSSGSRPSSPTRAGRTHDLRRRTHVSRPPRSSRVPPSSCR